MDRDSIDPLARETWFSSVGRLDASASAGSMAICSALRHAYHLVQLTPHDLRALVSAAMNEQEFEALLENEVYDVAAQALVGPPAGLALVRQPRSKAIFAEVRFPDGPGVGCGQSATMALAILQAWCRAALALDTLTGDARDRSPNAKIVRFHPAFGNEAASLGV